ncbi:MAG: twin-arginine translocation signal domain-containing protein, partial [Bacteroidales bacterium]
MKKEYKTQDPGIHRRNFIKTSAIGGIALSMMPKLAFGQKSINGNVQLGFIGVGGRGRSHLRNILRRDDIHVSAICDI